MNKASYKTPQFEKVITQFMGYNPETGLITWIKRPHVNSKRSVGDEVGGVGTRGYKSITFSKYRLNYAHIAWFLYYRSWPNDQIDHIDRDKTNNQISNLRDATPSDNSINRDYKSNTTGKTGVYTHVKDGAIIGYRASIMFRGTTTFLGLFKTFEEATKARLEAETKFNTTFNANYG